MSKESKKQPVKKSSISKQLNVLSSRLSELEKKNKKNVCYIECGGKGHGRWYFDHLDNWVGLCGCVEVFIFKCSNCGLEIAKTHRDLTKKEINALETLNILPSE